MRRSYWIFAALVALATGCSDGRLPIEGTGTSERIANAVDEGPVPSDAEFQFVIGLTLRAPEALHKYIGDQPFTGDTLAPDDFAEKFALAGGEYARFVSELRAQGLTVVATSAGHTTVTVRATAAQIQQVFGVEMHRYLDNQGVFVAANGYLRAAMEVVTPISGVVGLDGEQPWISHRIVNPAPVPQAGTKCQLSAASNKGLAPADLQALYGYAAAGVAQPGSGETIVILGAGGGPTANDLGSYVNAYTLATNVANQYHQVLVDGPNRDPGQDMDPMGEYGENVLDAEMAFALAPYATVQHVLTATNYPGLFTDGISKIVNDATLSKAKAVTVSYAGCERGAQGEMTVLNALFAQAQAQGQQWFFASGDTATDGCRNGTGNKIITASWPSSSPYVVAVGGSSFGTTVPTTATVTTAEQPWTDAGGAPSEAFDKPAYQTGVGTGANDNARDIPDVSAFADPNPGVCTIDSATSTTGTTFGGTGGTSAATPMMAAIWTVVHQSVHAAKGETDFTQGLATIYTIGKGVTGTNRSTQAWKDITTGSIAGPGGGAGGYAAATGFDNASGWGTPNLAQLISVWP